MVKEVTNDDLASMIKLGFDGVDKRFEAVDKRFEQVATKEDIQQLSQRLEKLERKVDRVLDDTLETHEKWFGELSREVGIKLSR